MDYKILSDAYQKIETTTKRLEMTKHLTDLLSETPKDLLSKIVYLTCGKLYPDFMGIEIGMAEKMVTKAVMEVTGIWEA